MGSVCKLEEFGLAHRNAKLAHHFSDVLKDVAVRVDSFINDQIEKVACTSSEFAIKQLCTGVFECKTICNDGHYISE